LRDTRPCQHRTILGMTSVAWSDRIQTVHEYRKSWNPDRRYRVHTQHAHINYNHNTIFNTPSLLYASRLLTRDLTVHVSNQEPYLVAFPDSSINQLVIMTINGLNNQGDSEVNNITNTLLSVYGLLHILVEQEIAEARELLRLDWNQRIHDSWEVSRRECFYPEDYEWLQYRIGPTVQEMNKQFIRESWEIYRRSDVLWEEKEMLWLSSLGERQRMWLRLPKQVESESSESAQSSESDEPWSPSTDAFIDFDILPYNHSVIATGQASTSS
jgi:hypothetical protein